MSAITLSACFIFFSRKRNRNEIIYKILENKVELDKLPFELSIKGLKRRKRIKKYKNLAKKYLIKFTKLTVGRRLRKIIDFFDPDDKDLGDLVDKFKDKD